MWDRVSDPVRPSEARQFGRGSALIDADRNRSVKIGVHPWSVSGGLEVNFELNNETYFIDLADEEGKWLVFAQTPTGVRRIPVYEDAPPSDEVKVVGVDRSTMIH